MTNSITKKPSRGRLFRSFTALGPYFRKLKSTESSFFFDSLEVCLDAEEEPAMRIFYGWNLTLTRHETSFNFERNDGLFNIVGEWENAKMSKKNQRIIDKSFNLFITRLQALIILETGLSLVESSVVQEQIAVLEEV